MRYTELTPRQEEFCQQWIIDRVGVAAAVRAGYSSKTAHVQASRLLKHAKVKARVEQLQKEAAERNRVTVDRVIAQLWDLWDKAVAAGQIGPAVRAEDLRGKTIGAFIDRTWLTKPDRGRGRPPGRGILSEKLTVDRGRLHYR